MCASWRRRGLRGRAFACCQAIGFTAVPVAAFLSYLLVPYDPLGLQGWRWVVLIGANGAIFIWWIRRALPESPRWLASQGRMAEAEAVVAALEAKVTAELGRELPSPNWHGQSPGTSICAICGSRPICRARS